MLWPKNKTCEVPAWSEISPLNFWIYAYGGVLFVDVLIMVCSISIEMHAAALVCSSIKHLKYRASSMAHDLASVITEVVWEFSNFLQKWGKILKRGFRLCTCTDAHDAFLEN